MLEQRNVRRFWVLVTLNVCNYIFFRGSCHDDVTTKSGQWWFKLDWWKNVELWFIATNIRARYMLNSKLNNYCWKVKRFCSHKVNPKSIILIRKFKIKPQTKNNVAKACPTKKAKVKNCNAHLSQGDFCCNGGIHQCKSLEHTSTLNKVFTKTSKEVVHSFKNSWFKFFAVLSQTIINTDLPVTLKSYQTDIPISTKITIVRLLICYVTLWPWPLTFWPRTVVIHGRSCGQPLSIKFEDRTAIHFWVMSYDIMHCLLWTMLLEQLSMQCMSWPSHRRQFFSTFEIPDFDMFIHFATYMALWSRWIQLYAKIVYGPVFKALRLSPQSACT